MKQSSCLRLLPYLFAVLLLFCACHDDAMPEQPASTDTEPPEALDAYHDKIREKPYPKADNELYLNPSPLIVPQTMKTGAKLQFSLSRSKNFDTPETVTSQAVAWCMFNPHKKLENGTWYWRFRKERDPSIRSKRNDSRFRYPAVRNIPTICTPHLPSPLLLSGRPNSGSTTRSKLTFRIPATDPKRRQCPQSRPDCHRQPIQPNQCHQKIRTKPLSSLLSDTAGDLCQTPARTAATIAQHPCERCRPV